MGDKVQEYRKSLAGHKSRRLFLLERSGLPGRRANLELAKAFAQTAGQRVINDFASLTSDEAPSNSPEEFLAFCGVLGLGRLAMEGKEQSEEKLRKAASDGRWRIREAVAMALHMIGHFDMDRLIGIAAKWSDGNCYEQRAAVAGLCEPDLLWDERHAGPVFAILDSVTANVEAGTGCSTEGTRILKKGLSYCWSVAVAAYPDEGKAAMENWIASGSTAVRRIMRNNLKKKRLAKMDPEWVSRQKQRA